MASANTGTDRLRAALDAAAAAELDRWVGSGSSVVRIEVTGRAGVGRTGLVAALGPVSGAEVVQTPAWDRPAAADPDLAGDVVVLVVLDPPRAADLAAATAAGPRLVPVLTKIDTVADPDGAAGRAAALLGAPCLPVSAVGRCSGIGPLRETLDRRVATVLAVRAAALLEALLARGATATLRDLVEEFLATDDGVRLAAAATGWTAGTGDPAEEARRWRARMNTAADADEARAALALHRAAVRAGACRA